MASIAMNTATVDNSGNSIGTNKTAYENPYDFAFVATRDPELLTVDSLMVGSGKSAAKTAAPNQVGSKQPGLINSADPTSTPYSLVMYARSGMYGKVDTLTSASGAASTLPFGLYYYTGTAPWDGKGYNRTQGSGGTSGMVSDHLVLRMWPVPNGGPQTELTGDTQTGATIFGGRPHGIGRMSPTQVINIGDWTVDSVLSAPPVTNLNGIGKPPPEWVEGYIAMWEALATPHPLLGRKPALALKFGTRWWGLGRMVCFLDSVSVQRNLYENGTLASAKVSLRFSEVQR